MTDIDVGKILFCSYHEGDSTVGYIEQDMYDTLNKQYSFSESLEKVTEIIADTLNLDLTFESLEVLSVFRSKGGANSVTYKIKGSKQTLVVGFDTCYVTID